MTAHPLSPFFSELSPAHTPGYAWSVSTPAGRLAGGFGGLRIVEPVRAPVEESTLFDLASLTKPLATALIALRAFDAGQLDVEAPVAGTGPPPFTLLDLLRHEAGFPDWLPLYGCAPSPAALKAWLLRDCPRKERAGLRAVYSCAGYVLLGMMLEEGLGAPMGQLFERYVSIPLGLPSREACFSPPAGWRDRCAAEELDGGYEARMARPLGATPPPFRSGMAWGEVHDGNARFLGGAAGNAGLFGTLAAVERLCRALSPQDRFLSPEALRLAWESPRAEGRYRTAGWKAAGSEGWWANALLPEGGIGHEGFTGTGVWMEPETFRTYILLTNRIHPRHPGTDFGKVRAAFLEAAKELQ